MMICSSSTSPVARRSGAELADAKDIVSWTFTVTSGILYHERFHVYEDEGEVSSMAPKLKSFQASVFARNNAMDVEVLFEQIPYNISCYCTSHWDGEFEFTLPGPLTRS
jgi:hypothetical protein